MASRRHVAPGLERAAGTDRERVDPARLLIRDMDQATLLVDREEAGQGAGREAGARLDPIPVVREGVEHPLRLAPASTADQHEHGPKHGAPGARSKACGGADFDGAGGQPNATKLQV